MTLDLRAPSSRPVIALAQNGDRAALDQLLRALQAPLYAHVLGIVRDPDVAKDALQDTLLLIARKIGWLRDPQWLRAWAYRIATREAVRHARLGRRWAAALTEIPAGSDSADDRFAEDPLFDPAAVAEVTGLLAALPPASQAVLRLHYLESMTYPEIAAALEIPVGTVKSRVAYGLALLRKRSQHPASA